VYENDKPRWRCHGDLRQRRATMYKPLARPGRVTHAAAHPRPATDVAPTDVAPTAVFDRRGAHRISGFFFWPAARRTPQRTTAKRPTCHPTRSAAVD